MSSMGTGTRGEKQRKRGVSGDFDRGLEESVVGKALVVSDAKS